MNLPLIAIGSLTLAILYGAGSSIGLPYLFWSDNPLTRVAAAASVVLLLTLLGVLSFYADPNKELLVKWSRIFLEVLAFPFQWTVNRVRDFSEIRAADRYPALATRLSLPREPARSQPEEVRPLLTFLIAVSVPLVPALIIPAAFPDWFIGRPARAGDQAMGAGPGVVGSGARPRRRGELAPDPRGSPAPQTSSAPPGRLPHQLVLHADA